MNGRDGCQHESTGKIHFNQNTVIHVLHGAVKANNGGNEILNNIIVETTESAFRDYLDGVGYDLCELEPPHRLMTSIPKYGHALLRPST